AADSNLIASAYLYLKQQAARIQDPKIRASTIDVLTNPKACIASRAGLTAVHKAAIVETLVRDGLMNPADSAAIAAGPAFGVFPPVSNEGSDCPTLPMPIEAAPGGAFSGHHSHPGGLMLHEQFNLTSSLAIAENYRRVYRLAPSELSQDLLIAAPIWHDW